MKILIVVTSNSQLGDIKSSETFEKTGFWIEEFAAPYYIFKDAGAVIVIASPNGGQAPIDPKSELPENQTNESKRYYADLEAQKLIANTVQLKTVSEADFDAIFYPGGHGLLWDLTANKDSIALIENFWKANKPVATVCHSPAVLLHAKDADGNYIIKDKKVTGFSNSEEEAVKLSKIVPFLLEDELKNCGAKYHNISDWTSFAISDGLLITGQNPQSSVAVAHKLIDMLQ